MDLTPSLAAIAQKRVEQHGWSDLVNVVCGDATDPKLEGLPAAGSVDVVTISYAITMIPNWQDAIDNALRLLKPGGRLCVCDFTVAPDQNPLMRAAFVKVRATTAPRLGAVARPGCAVLILACAGLSSRAHTHN